ncbi:hypothetical protein BJY24_006280 [Nocardia transvalensis]|uniref:Uncharacterized protein n=1 Tax=Nocardia transvalensis TaxID=37333 RepID=A0A7W9PKH5_9NOCA|nr:hypothetical protein [Nocardia transvalensis]MBB5917368.1 hypothetical protein [Nocardia transvalensis]
MTEPFEPIALREYGCLDTSEAADMKIHEDGCMHPRNRFLFALAHWTVPTVPAHFPISAMPTRTR